MSDERSIELEIEVPGTPEEVWRAIATGPGISSWYVPHTVEEHEGGEMDASFGPGPEMQVHGRVAAWEPPHRVVFDGGEGVDGTRVRVAGRGARRRQLRRAPREHRLRLRRGVGRAVRRHERGLALFLRNLKLHLSTSPVRPRRRCCRWPMWTGTPEQTWVDVTTALGVPADAAIGERIEATAADAPALAGTVVGTGPNATRPGPRPARPGYGDRGGRGHRPGRVSIWSYLYGEDGAAAVERDAPRWQQWLDHRAGASG